MPNYVYSSQSEFKFQDDKKDIILLVGSQAKLANCFINALENEFPNLDLIYCKNLQNVEELQLSTIKLINLVIIHHGINDENISQIDRLKKIFVSQPIALAYSNTNESTSYVKMYGNHFDSHLPMDIKLDVWLSIIRLILAGGDYICPELLKDHYQKLETPCNIIANGSSNIVSSNGHNELPKIVAQHNSCLTQLTGRETDVIRLMAAGQQNKVIAASLDISEHTVKLHIHHIISKLNVSNRTEAAALFLNAEKSGEEHC